MDFTIVVVVVCVFVFRCVFAGYLLVCVVLVCVFVVVVVAC